jgi:KaiC/GvpD/RAD55 family RecA-like ATPase
MLRHGGIQRRSGLVLGTEGVAEPRMTVRLLVETIRRIVKEEGIQRIAVDPITSIMLRYDQPYKRRRAMLTFFDSLIESGCTSLVTTELRTGMLKRRFQLEEFLSQGVILLHTLVHAGNVVRAIQIEKMRGIPHDAQLRPYQITSNGIEVYPKDRIFQDTSQR